MSVRPGTAWGALPRAVLAAVAGAAGALLIYVAFRALGNVTLSGPIGIFSPITPADHLFVLVQLLLIFLGYLAAVGIGGALPARALGATWRRSLLSAVVVPPVAYLLVVLPLVALSSGPTQGRAVVLLFWVALLSIIATKVNVRVTAAVLLAALIFSPFVFVLALRYGTHVGLFAWLILPPVAVLAQAWLGRRMEP